VDVGDWLRSLGLEQYEAVFRDNAIDYSILPSLTSEDLKDLGVDAVGHRRKLLNAIAALYTNECAPPASYTPTAVGRPPSNSAERRQVTVIFSDLVGSTALSARMDPEDLREVISAYQKCVVETVRPFGGFVAKYMGDGVLIYFGYPQAHEDDAERAVRAALELIGAVNGLKLSVQLQARAGVATGLVVVGELIGSGEAQERGIVGETPNLAARLQGIAEPNTVVIADSTRRLVGNLFELKDLGNKALKGINGSVRVWVPLRVSFVASRFEALHATALTELIGREEEFELLLRRWSKAKAGEGQAVLLSGEAGIGKSRLTAALLERLSSEPHTRLRYFCSPQHTDSAFYPIIGQMERAAGFAHDDTLRTKCDKLDAMLAQSSTGAADAALFAEMLSISNDGRYPATPPNPQQRRQKTLKALVAQIDTLARSNPALMVFEDAHWIDPTSLEVLGRVVQRIATLPVLLVVTFRPEFVPPWTGRPHVTSLMVNRLARRDVMSVIDRIVGNKVLAEDIRKDIIEHTDGIPLFVEEMTKAVLEAEDEGEAKRTAANVASPALAVPATLHASLMARLDRLGPAKDVAQIGAAIGREFSHALLASVIRLTDTDLESALDRLIQAGLLFRQGVPPHASYLFKHALVQDAAYGTLLREPRRALHAQIVNAVESQFPEIAATQPALIAKHCAQASLDDKAIGYWLSAGQQAISRSANVEALSHITSGLELLKTMSESTDIRQQEIKFLTTRAVALRIAKGYGSDELLATLERARDLCRMQGDPRQMFQILFGLWTARAGHGDWLHAQALAEECLAIARDEGEATMLIEAHRLLGSTAVYTAKHPIAERHFRDALDLYEPQKHRGNSSLYGYDPGTTCYGYMSWALWFQGKVKEALTASATSIQLAIESQHAPNLALAYGWATFLHLCVHDLSALRSLTPKLIAHCDEHEFPHWLALGKIGHGWCLGRTGDVGHGLEWLRAGINEFRSLWGGFFVSAWLVCLADILRIKGDFAEANSALDSSLKMIERFNERLWEAENYRVRGEVARDAGQIPEALSAFEQAIKVARDQSALSLELRAANSFAKLLADRGERRRAHSVLAPICNMSAESFETIDLTEAKALLDELVQLGS
jgi:class 3 adenylate cyclase/tetratricopeptide (TPR) repeat protein